MLKYACGGQGTTLRVGPQLPPCLRQALLVSGAYSRTLEHKPSESLLAPSTTQS